MSCFIENTSTQTWYAHMRHALFLHISARMRDYVQGERITVHRDMIKCRHDDSSIHKRDCSAGGTAHGVGQ